MVKTMIVIPNNLKLNELRCSGGYKLAESGINQYSIGAYVPLFKQGGKCIGLAKITAYSCDANKTIVTFGVYKDIDDEQLEAFALLYDLNSGSGVAGNEDEPYDNPDESVTMKLIAGQPQNKKQQKSSGIAAIMKKNGLL